MRRFCPDPFEYAEIGPNGDVSACGAALLAPVGNVRDSALADIWSGAAAADARSSVADGSLGHCRQLFLCPRLNNGRLSTLADGETLAAGRLPARLALSYDPDCATAEDLARITDQVIAAIEAGAGTETIRIGDRGDPFANPNYRRLLEYLADTDRRPANIELRTDASLLTEGTWGELAGLESSAPSIEVVLDSVWPWTPSSGNGPDRQTFAENLGFAARLRSEGRIGRFTLAMTIRADNYHQIPELVDIGRALGCDSVILSPLRHGAIPFDSPPAPDNVCDPRHPENPAFREILRGPAFRDPLCRFDNLTTLRAAAMKDAPVDESLNRDREAAMPPEDYVTWAASLMERKRFIHALALLTAGMQRHPDSASIWVSAGMATLALGAPSRAADLFYRARSLSADNNITACLWTALGMAGRVAEQSALATA